ncbi:hypothetical protein JOE48_002676 [Methylobacterium sp. PvR107]|nr:hypothetical protein [Methylobacterium sp. PvR107]
MKQVSKGFFARRAGDVPASVTDILLVQHAMIACHRMKCNYEVRDYF